MALAITNLETFSSAAILPCNGYSIHYYVSGQKGNPMLIFLHAAFCDHRCFDAQLEFFAQHYRIVTLDLLAHGLSVAYDTKDTIEATNQHLLSIMEAEGYAKAHVVGASMGSLLAQYFAIVHPDKVETLTVLGGYNINPVPDAIKKAQFTEGLKWIIRAVFSMKAFRRYVSRVSAYKVESQQLIYKMAKLFTLKSFKVMRGLGKVTQLKQDQKVMCPILIVCGRHDLKLAINASYEWYKDEPLSRIEMIEEAGHLANIDNPKVFNNVLFDFLTSEFKPLQSQNATS